MNIFATNMKFSNSTSIRTRGSIIIHMLAWAIVFGLPIFFAIRGGFFNWSQFVRFLPLPISYLIVFYANYLFLTEKLLFDKKTWSFILINVLMIVGLALLLHLWHEVQRTIEFSKGTTPPPPPPDGNGIPTFVFILRDVGSLTFIAISSIVIKTSMRLSAMQSKQNELEKAMTEAELKNLKNQLNPHFLLNTLNNIYALSQFNSPKTSTAILELSDLLRYVLYDNEKTYVLLRNEAHFIQNYVDLMKLRLTDNVGVSLTFDIDEQSNTMIAPLIYISLIENAFKHGVSNDDPSVVEINLREKENGEIYFLCRNTYFPKNESDKSGSGIGLLQVRKRLDLLYPDQYVWHSGIEDGFYSTLLIINKSRDNGNA